MEFTSAHLVTMAVAVVGAIPGVLLFIRQLRQDKAQDRQRAKTHAMEAEKGSAEASALMVEATEALIAPLKDRIKEQEAELAEQRETLRQQAELIERQDQRITALERQNEALAAGARRLIHQVRAHALEPAWDFDQMPDAG
jgi:hypothetical protein